MNSTINLTEPINPLFIEYGKNKYYQLCLYLSAWIFAGIGFIGIIFNLSVCIVTAKYRKYYLTLKCNTGFLLALASFFEIFHQSGHLIFLIKIIFFGMDFIPYKQAILIHTPSLFGFFGAVFMLVSLSVDRLLAVIIPITYRNLKQFYYISLHVLIILLHIIYGMFIMNMAKISTPNWMISGGLGDLFTPPLFIMNIIYYSDVCIMFTATIVYLIVGILIKFKTEVKDERIKKMYLSLFLIVLVNIGGYFICNLFVAFLLLSIVQLTPVNIWIFNNIFAIFLNIAAASIGPILYFNSGEYRIAFKRAFNDVKKLLKLNKSGVSTINVVIVNNQKEMKITPVSK
uniref:G-protein coupled receptors family 1 profile domain-containing protein n=1 Tax=Meloidogyne enterolobii TaxID=390850 RepID=A0A6V7WIP6_MELEN|nr:unnamed protein product [Meloidogyne enterolobii]